MNLPNPRSGLHKVESLTAQQIDTFCQVYEQGGYAGAADALGLAGPTIWEQVKSLERIYQTKLFERVGRNVQPTTSGRALYEILRPLLATMVSTFERLAEATDHGTSQISLVTGVRMMLEELGKPLRRFQELFPNARLKLMNADNATAQRLVLEGKADLAILIEPPQDFIAKGIAYEYLYPIDYLVALPPRHRLIHKPKISLADLVNESLIVGNESTIGRKMLEQARFRLGINIPLTIVAETDNSAMTLACVQAGLGIGIIAGRTNGNLTRRVTIRNVSGEMGQANVVAAYRKGRELTHSLHRLLALIQSIT